MSATLLAEEPEGWNTKRIKHSTVVKARIGWQGLRTEEFCDEGPYLVTGTDFHHGRVNWKTCYHVSEERYLEDPHIHLREGDLLITKDGSIGKLAIAEHMPAKATLNSGVFVTRPLKRDYLNKFLYYVLSSNVFTEFVRYRSSGTTISHLYQNVFVDFAFSVPVIEAQQSIIDFLDYETSKIDGLIAKKQRLIELLDEKRAALISRAVTQGLHPNVPMKDSGVEWLGVIPAHWTRIRIKFGLLSLIDTEHKTAPFYPDGSFLVVRTTNIKSGSLIFKDAKYTDEYGFRAWTTRGRPHPGDIMFTREAPAGEACIVPEALDLCLGQRVVLMRLASTELLSCFTLWALYGGLSSEFIMLLSQGTTVLHFNMQDIKNIPLLRPPLQEQLEIAKYLTRETSKLDEICAKTRSSVDLLREYRSALITAAVTGQIDIGEHEKKMEALAS